MIALIILPNISGTIFEFLLKKDLDISLELFNIVEILIIFVISYIFEYGFIKELMKQTGYDKEKCTIMSNSLEDNFLFGKNSKTKTINALINNLNCEEKEANKIYNITSLIITKEIKNKIKTSFKNLDK